MSAFLLSYLPTNGCLYFYLVFILEFNYYFVNLQAKYRFVFLFRRKAGT